MGFKGLVEFVAKSVAVMSYRTILWITPIAFGTGVFLTNNEDTFIEKEVKEAFGLKNNKLSRNPASVLSANGSVVDRANNNEGRVSSSGQAATNENADGSTSDDGKPESETLLAGGGSSKKSNTENSKKKNKSQDNSSKKSSNSNGSSSESSNSSAGGGGSVSGFSVLPTVASTAETSNNSSSDASSSDASSSNDIGTIFSGSSNSAPVISASDRLFPLDGTDEPLVQGTQYTIASVSDADGDSVTLDCTYQTLGLDSTDPNYAASGSDCEDLDSIVSNSSVLSLGILTLSSSSITWRPTNTQRGTYQFNLAAIDDVNNVVTKVFYVTVRENFSTTNLLAGLDSYSSDGYSSLTTTPTIPRLNGSANDDISSWMGIFNSYEGDISGFLTAAPWTGTGVYSSPYRLTFDGSGDEMDMGSVLDGMNRVLFSTWISTSSALSTNDVILSTGAQTTSGFVLKQSDLSPGKLEFIVGAKTYQSLIVDDAPVGYWRLGESSTGVAADDVMNTYDGTYSGDVTVGSESWFTYNPDNAATFNATLSTGKVQTTSPIITGSSDFTIEAWINSTNTTAFNSIAGNYGLANSTGMQLYIGTGKINAFISGAWLYGTINLSNNTWYHVVLTRNNGVASLYVNGVLDVSGTLIGAIGAGANFAIGNGPDYTHERFLGKIDEVALYNYPISAQQVRNHYRAGLQHIFPDNAMLAKGPVGYWKLNENSGVTAADSTINALDATLSGSPALSAQGALSDHADKSILFDGTDDKAEVSSLALNPSKFSAMLWVRPNGGAGTWRSPLTSRGVSADGFLFYASNANTWEAWVGNGAWTVSNGPAVTLNSWVHLAMTYDGTTLRFYVNGALVDSDVGAITPNATHPLRIGSGTGGAGTADFFFPGNVDEVAVFDRVLTATDISSLYTTSNYYKCLSASTIEDGEWNQVAGLWNGTSAKLFINGKEECSITPGTFVNSTTDLFVGAHATPSNHWAGAIADLKIYGSSDGSSVGSATSVKSDFDESANRFRATPLEDIVTDGLIVNLDAANAKSGILPYGSGCDATDLRWRDISQYNQEGMLRNFSGCGASSGWLGTGIPTDPYRLNLDGTNDHVYFELFSAHLQTTAVTLEWWFKSSNATPTQIGLDVAGWYRLYLSGGKMVVDYNIGGSIIGTNLQYSTANISNNTWYHAVWTYDGTNSKMYINGALDNTRAQAGAIWGQWGVAPLTVGGYYTGIFTLNGQMTAARMYSRALSLEEISQNCKMQKDRMDGASCN